MAGITTGEMASRGVKKIEGAITPLQKGMMNGGSKAIAGAAMFIGATSIIDAGVTARRNKETRKETERQNIKKEDEAKRDNQYRKRARRRDSRDSINMGNTVMQMFEQRTGHHKMGGSKNYPV